jgi:hypothetical protein
MGHPQGPQRGIRAAARVFLQRLQSILRRFPALMAVFGRNKVEPPCGGFFQRLVYFEVALWRSPHSQGGVMGRPGRWSNGGCHIISGMEHMIVSLPRAAPARERQDVRLLSGPMPGAGVVR